MKEKKIISSENFRKIIDGIYEFEKLPVNWDKHAAARIENSVITRAILLINAVKEKGLIIEKYPWPRIVKLATDDEIERVTNDLKKDYRDNEFYEPFLEAICPKIVHHGMEIIPTPEGSVEFGWGCHTSTTVTIPVEENQGIKYEIGYFDQTLSHFPYVLCEKGRLFDCDEITNLVYDNFSPCL